MLVRALGSKDFDVIHKTDKNELYVALHEQKLVLKINEQGKIAIFKQKIRSNIDLGKDDVIAEISLEEIKSDHEKLKEIKEELKIIDNELRKV